MRSYKADRTAEDIRRELAVIIDRLRDPRVKDAFISVVKVEVTRDLSYCTIYISALEGFDRAKQALKGLESASGFISRELAHSLRLRKVPEMKFCATDGIEHSANISRILNELDIGNDVADESGDEADNDEFI